MPGAYHRRRVAPAPDRRRSRSRSRPASSILRSFGPSYRVGRLLASTPQVTVAEARGAGRPVRRATSGSPAGSTPRTDVRGRAHRPLVFRRTRLEVRGRPRLDDARRPPRGASRSRSAKASTRSPSTTTALDTGLVVMPRESVGTAADAPDRVPAGTPPDTPRPPPRSTRSPRSSTRSCSACRPRTPTGSRGSRPGSGGR